MDIAPTPTQEILDVENAAAEAIEKLAAGNEQKEALSEMLDLQKSHHRIHAQYLVEQRTLQARLEVKSQPLKLQRRPLIDQIPDFWLRTLKNHPLASSFVYEHDEKLLKHLVDIRYLPEEDSFNFTLEFEFSPNEFIGNQVLVKKYTMTSNENMTKAESTQISWKKENFTQTVKMTKRKGKRGKKQLKVVDRPSFFKFFRDIDEDNSDDEDSKHEEEDEDPFEDDFEIASEFRDEIIPNCVLYYMDIRGDIEESEDSEEDKAPKQSRKVDASGPTTDECKTQ